jgi:hypothetical protein
MADAGTDLKLDDHLVRRLKVVYTRHFLLIFGELFSRRRAYVRLEG